MAQEKYLGENGLKRLVGLVKEDLGTKANIDGSYDTMQVGSAKQIVSPTGITDTTPYVFRTTCGETSISGGDEQLATLKGIRGNTIAWNQLCSNASISQTINGVTFTNNGDGSWTINGTAEANTYKGIHTPITLTANHKYLIKGTTSDASYGSITLVDSYGGDGVEGEGKIITAKTNRTFQLTIYVNKGTTVSNKVFRPQLFDLTQMFGPGNEPTSVLEFNRLFPKTYYPFNPGEIRNAKTTGLKTTGYNAFDGKWTGTTQKVSANFIKVIPGKTYTLEALNLTTTYKILQQYDANKALIKNYYLTNKNEVNSITLENNTCYVKLELRFASATDIPLNAVSFHLTWSGSRTGYAPHEEHVLDIDTSRYFPDGMNGIDGVYDELTPKIASKRIGTYTFTGNETFVDEVGAKTSLAIVINNMASPNSIDDVAILRSAFGRTISYRSMLYYDNLTEYNMCVGKGGRLYIATTKKSSELASALSGKTIYFALAEPVVTEIPQVRDNHWEIKVDDYGTEEWLFPEGDEIPVPVGHETLYMDNLVDKLRNLPDPEDYKALESELQTWVKLPPLPTDTTKVYVPKFVNGTIQWVEE